MKALLHRKTDEGFDLHVEVAVADEAQAAALLALGEHSAGGETEIEDDVATVKFTWGPIYVDPETGNPTMSQKDYAERQVRETALLIQSALDRVTSAAKPGTKLDTEGTEIAEE